MEGKRGMEMEIKYKRILIEKEDDLFIAQFPVLGLVAQGETEKEAEDNIIEAIGLYVVTFLEMNTVEEFINDLNVAEPIFEIDKSDSDYCEDVKYFYYCDKECPYFNISKENEHSAWCNYTDRHIDFYDAFIAHCQFGKDDENEGEKR